MAQSAVESLIRLLIARAGGNPAGCQLPRLPHDARILVQKAPDDTRLVVIAPRGRDAPSGGSLVVLVGTVVEISVAEAWVMVRPEPDEAPIRVRAAAARIAPVVRGNRVWVQGRLCGDAVEASFLTVVEIKEGPCTTK